MSDDTPLPATQPPTSSTPPAGVGRMTLLWFGLAIVILSFFAAFLGSWLARTVDTTAGEPTPSPTSTATVEDYEAALEEILPAGAAVRAGSGVPEAGKGYDGDVYIDVATADVYLFEDGEWKLVGNIRESAAENLTGATGATGASGADGEQGEQGAQGEQGEQGEQGDPGTQVSLGEGEPAQDTCLADEIYIDTSAPMFYQCADGAWVAFAPPADDTVTEG